MFREAVMFKGRTSVLAALLALACGESEKDDTICCISPTGDDEMECLQLENYAKDERCDGEGEERAGTCAANGYPHRCEGEPASIYAEDQCACREGC